MGQLNTWRLRIPTAESGAFLHLWQVTAHMLGVQDEYIPASWDEANARARSWPRSWGPRPRGSHWPTSSSTSPSSTSTGTVAASSAAAPRLTRYMLGRSPTGCRSQEWYWDGLVEWAWPRFVALREGALLLPLSPDIAWAFDEILHGVLFYLGEDRASTSRCRRPTGRSDPDDAARTGDQPATIVAAGHPMVHGPGRPQGRPGAAEHIVGPPARMPAACPPRSWRRRGGHPSRACAACELGQHLAA